MDNLVRLEDAPWYPALPMIISRNPLRTSSCPYGQGVDQDSGQEILGEDRPVRHAGRAYLAMLGVAVLAAAAGFVLGDSRAAPDARPEEGVTAFAWLSCNGPLPGGQLNVNLSWGEKSDSVTLATGDGRVIELDPSVSDNQRLADAVRHQYAEGGGRYEVTLTSRIGEAQASAACIFVAGSSVDRAPLE